MEKYIWLFPLIFIFHDMEEIIGFGIWGRKNIKNMAKRFPKLAPTYQNMYEPYSTEGMALAVFEILILCILICLASIIFKWYYLWVGTFIACIFHFFIHFAQAIIFKGYIPAVATSIISAPLSIIIVFKSLKVLQYSIGNVVIWSVVGLILITLNVKFAHFLMHWFTKKYFCRNAN